MRRRRGGRGPHAGAPGMCVALTRVRGDNGRAACDACRRYGGRRRRATRLAAWTGRRRVEPPAAGTRGGGAQAVAAACAALGDGPDVVPTPVRTLASRAVRDRSAAAS